MECEFIVIIVYKLLYLKFEKEKCCVLDSDYCLVKIYYSMDHFAIKTY